MGSVLLAACVLGLPFAPAQAEPAASRPAIGALPERSARTQRYFIDATLAEDAASLTGRARIELRNPGPAPIPDVELHLYWNGWKNNRSTWLREQEGGAGRRPSRRVREESYGAIDLEALRLASAGSEAVNLMPGARFVAPDDGNPEDETVLRVALPAPLAPGETLALETEFKLTVPRIVARAGRKGDFLLFAHWYPQLGVFEKKRDGSYGWNTHQFHAGTEFFGEYASYDVTLTLPGRFEEKVGATGVRAEGPAHLTDGRVRYRFAQDDVHNFAWTADSEFVVERRRFTAADAELDAAYADEKKRVAKATGLSPAELALSDVDVTILLQPEHADQADRHYRAVSAALRYLGLWHGRYPYPTLTVVDPRWGSGAGGMEYPTLITAGTRIDPHADEFIPEGVTVHEFAHQFFYGLIGNNEFEHAWLDEGFTTYSASRVLAKAYGEDHVRTLIGVDSFEGRPVVPFPQTTTALERLLTLQELAIPSLRESHGIAILPDDPALRWWRELPFLTYVQSRRPPVETNRSAYLGRSAKADRLDRETYLHLDGGASGTNSYQKPATVLATLERILGPETWLRTMRAYATRYRFGHPRPEDFYAVLEEQAGPTVSGAPLSSFIEQTFRGSDLLDYGIESAQTREVAPPLGWFGRGAERRFLAKPAGANGSGSAPAEARSFASEFVVARVGEVIWPVEVEWKREGEAPQRAQWDGRERRWRMRFESGPKLEWARVDPDRKLILDANFTNNAFHIEGDDSASLRWTLRALLGVQAQLAFYGALR